MANESTDNRHKEPPYPLNFLEDTPELSERAPNNADEKQWMRIPPKQRVQTLAQVDVYVEDFISNCQGVPKEKCQMLYHLFRIICKVFSPNMATYGLCKEPISTKNIC